MPVASQYVFKHQELVKMLVKEAGVHEGKWMLLVNFTLAAANVGVSEDQVSPAGIVAVAGLGIQQAAPDAPPSLVVDAAVVNPAST